VSALLTSVTDPETLPEVDGVKTALNVAVFPAATVNGALNLSAEGSSCDGGL
jgi:hypothetical protein